MIQEYLGCLAKLPEPSLLHKLADLLSLFNSRCCQLVLGGGATTTLGLRSITIKHLALTGLYDIIFSNLFFDTLKKFGCVQNCVSENVKKVDLNFSVQLFTKEFKYNLFYFSLRKKYSHFIKNAKKL